MQEESRAFSIYSKADGGKLLDIFLGHGDILVMHGGTQAVLLHDDIRSKKMQRGEYVYQNISSDSSSVAALDARSLSES